MSSLIIKTVISVAVGLLLVLMSHFAGASLEVRVEDKPLHYGESFRIYVQSDFELSKLANMDVSALEADFEIDQDESSGATSIVEGELVISSTRTLRIYPKKQGRLTIPSFDLGDDQSERRVTFIGPVAPSLPEIKVSILSSKAQFLTRETVYLSATLEYASEAEPKITPRNLARNRGWHSLVSSTSKRITAESADKAISQTKITWEFTAFRAGYLRLVLPPIEIKLRQRVRPLRLYPESLNLTIQATPLWLPDSVHVGPVSLSSKKQPDGLYSGQPAFWDLTVDANGLPQSTIEQALLKDVYGQAFNSVADIQFYQAEYLRRTAPEQGWRVRIPFVAKEAREYTLPSLQLQFFNSETGRLSVASLSSENVLIKSKLMEGMVKWLLLEGLIGVLLVLAWFVVRSVQRLLHRSRYYAALDQCQDWQAVKALVDGYGQTGDSPELKQLWYSRDKPELSTIKLAARHISLSR